MVSHALFDVRVPGDFPRPARSPGPVAGDGLVTRVGGWGLRPHRSPLGSVLHCLSGTRRVHNLDIRHPLRVVYSSLVSSEAGNYLTDKKSVKIDSAATTCGPATRRPNEHPVVIVSTLHRSRSCRRSIHKALII
ncbi:hypothetical protein J6590_020074 [Homalodisca vitripennis]|nr:hypothetical protein J6590_020074 [Homalodisca vitripennis]